VDEKQSLFDLMEGANGKESLVEHLRGDTMLNPMLGVYTVSIMGITRVYSVMSDAGLGIRYSEAREHHKLASQKKCKKESLRKYDLKGSSRKVKDDAVPNPNKSVGGNVEFMHHEANMFSLEQSDCNLLVNTVAEDAAFLQTYDMIDYSLLATYGRRSCGSDSCNQNLAANRASRHFPAQMCFKSLKIEDRMRGKNPSGDLLAVSIIDYLNPFKGAKVAESALFGGKFVDYNGSIVDFAHDACVVGQYDKPQLSFASSAWVRFAGKHKPRRRRSSQRSKSRRGKTPKKL